MELLADDTLIHFVYVQVTLTGCFDETLQVTCSMQDPFARVQSFCCNKAFENLG